jgi:hypothetical protein
VCLDADGVAYVTDSFQPVIYRVDARDGSAGEFVRDAQMAAPMGQFGLNGIVVTPDGEAIIGGFTSPSKLFLIPRNAPDARPRDRPERRPLRPSRATPTSPAPTASSSSDDTLYVVHDGGVQQVTFTAKDYSRGTVKSVIAPESGLTTATVADGELYVIKAEVVRAMHMQLPPDLPFKIYRFPLELFTTPE